MQLILPVKASNIIDTILNFDADFIQYGNGDM